MRPLKLFATVLVLLFLFAGAAFAKAPPKHVGLDPTFGKNGKVTLSVEATGPNAPALLTNSALFSRRNLGIPTKILPLGKGRTLVASGRRLFSFEASGQLNTSFGNGGVLEIPAPASQQLVPHDVAIDPQGRILIAGEVQNEGAGHETLPSGKETGVAYSSQLVRAVAIRLQENGVLDPSFGSGGFVESTFGFPPPKDQDGESYATPVAQAFAIASNASGQTILSGDFVTGSQRCYPFTGSTYPTQGFVARLGTNGAVEAASAVTGSTFGATLAPVPGEQFALLNWQGSHCERTPENEPSSVSLLDANGSPVAGYAAPTIVDGTVAAMAVDSTGRTVLAGFGEEVGLESGFPYLTRLRTDGSRDTSLGGGVVHLPAGFEVASVTVDSQNRPIVLGHLGDEGSVNGYRLLRYTARGVLDTRFGKNGSVSIPWTEAAGSLEAAAVFVDGAGRIDIAGRATNGDEPKLKLARYLPAK